MLESHDAVLKQMDGEEVGPYETSTSPPGGDRTIQDNIPERAEKLTRVRLVQFHKNPNEPMVCHTAIVTAFPLLGDFLICAN